MSSKSNTLFQAFLDNFLGNAPTWYKQTILAFLVINPLLLVTIGPFWTGWVLIAEFIFTLAMALKCYPLQPGGLLALEAIVLGMSSPESVLHEVTLNLEVILLLMFMVAGIYFMKNMLLFMFTKVLVKVRSNWDPSRAIPYLWNPGVPIFRHHPRLVVQKQYIGHLQSHE